MNQSEKIFHKTIIALAMSFIKNVAGGRRWNDPEIKKLIEDKTSKIYTDEEVEFEIKTIAQYHDVMKTRFVTPFTSEADILYAHPDLANNMVLVANNQARVITAVFGIGMTQSLIDIANLTPRVSQFLRSNGCHALADACTCDVSLAQIQTLERQTAPIVTPPSLSQ